MIALDKIGIWCSSWILVLMAFFQISIIAVSASPVSLEQRHHTGISEVYTYNEIESSVWAEVDRTGRLSRVLSVKEARPDHEVLADVMSVAAKGVGLSDDVARTFVGSRYSKIVLDKPVTLSRYYDNVNAFAEGRYMTNPSSITNFKFADRMGLALKPQWNGMSKVANWNLPAGTTRYKGRAAMQFPWIGGRTQYFVPNLNNITRTIR